MVSSIPAIKRALPWGLALLLGASAALAQPQPSPSDLAIAEALFQEGKRLMGEQKYDDACPKLADSLRIAPGGGTELALAQCYEASGKTASAWTMYNQSITTSRRNGRADREKMARERVEAIEPRLSRLILRLAPANEGLAGLEIRSDEGAVPLSALGVPLPVDPGPHRITATAPGRKPWSLVVQVRPDGDRHSLEIPPLEPLATPAPSASASAAPPPTAPASSPSAGPPAPGPTTAPRPPSRAFAYGALGVGALGAAAGTILLLRASALHSDSTAVCPSSPCSDRQAVDDSKSARSLANWSTVGFGVGALGLAAGAYLLLSAPAGGQSARGWVAPWVGQGTAGLGAGSRWLTASSSGSRYPNTSPGEWRSARHRIRNTGCRGPTGTTRLAPGRGRWAPSWSRTSPPTRRRCRSCRRPRCRPGPATDRWPLRPRPRPCKARRSGIFRWRCRRPGRPPAGKNPRRAAGICPRTSRRSSTGSRRRRRGPRGASGRP